MRYISYFFLVACSLFKAPKEFKTSPPVPPAVPDSKISKPTEYPSIAIEQVKTFYCIKFEENHKNHYSCKIHAKKMLAQCQKFYKMEEKILICLKRLLKV